MHGRGPRKPLSCPCVCWERPSLQSGALWEGVLGQLTAERIWSSQFAKSLKWTTSHCDNKTHRGVPGGSGVKNLLASAEDLRLRFHPWVGEIPWRKAWQSSPVFLPEESHGQRSLVDCSPWRRKESDTTKATEHLKVWLKCVPSVFPTILYKSLKIVY